MSATLEQVVHGVTAVIGAVVPVIDMASPEAGSVVALAGKVLSAAAAAEPTAVALVKQISDGVPATQAQVEAAIAAYSAAYHQLDADIAAGLAVPPSV